MWDKIKKTFTLSLKFEMTSTKILAWYFAIMSVLVIDFIPKEARAFFLISVWGISAALYGVKTWSDNNNNNNNNKQKR